MVADERIVSTEAVRTVLRRSLASANLVALDCHWEPLSRFAGAGPGRAAEAVGATRVLDAAATVAAGVGGDGLAPGLIVVSRAGARSGAPPRVAPPAPRLSPDV
jgi:hypothetical protein